MESVPGIFVPFQLSPSEGLDRVIIPGKVITLSSGATLFVGEVAGLVTDGDAEGFRTGAVISPDLGEG